MVGANGGQDSVEWRPGEDPATWIAEVGGLELEVAERIHEEQALWYRNEPWLWIVTGKDGQIGGYASTRRAAQAMAEEAVKGLLR